MNEVDYYLQLILDPHNPVFIVILFTVLFFYTSYFIYRQILLPMQKKWNLEKREYELKAKELELTNLRIVAAFIESDPNPIFRAGPDCRIIQCNRAAKTTFNVEENFHPLISEILPTLDLDCKKEIEENATIKKSIKLNTKEYGVFFYGMKNLGMGQIYLIDITDSSNHEKRLIESEQKYRELSFHLQDSFELEKRKIAMELHDSLGQSLLLIKLKLNNELSGAQSNPAILQDISTSLDTAIEELRGIMFDLKPRALDDFGLLEAVKLLSGKIILDNNMTGSVDFIGTPVRLEKKKELYMFRIIQEALNNILKHSQAKEYEIQFIYSTSYLKIIISDHGIGFDPDSLKNRGYGLLNMGDRINVINGTMKIKSAVNEGTLLIFELPY
jgi:two-component system, NarL family, sensor histidine kinase UhpB